MKEKIVELFSELLASADTTAAKDLKLNFKRLFTDGALSEDEAALTMLACAKSLDVAPLQEIARTALSDGGFSPELIREAEDSAAIMGMLNIYYRFRHFVDVSADATGSGLEDYGPAKLRMQSLANPQMGKQRFEMLSFAVSVINGCEKCVTSHEKALLQLNVSREKIHELARFAAVTAGLKQVFASHGH